MPGTTRQTAYSVSVGMKNETMEKQLAFELTSAFDAKDVIILGRILPKYSRQFNQDSKFERIVVLKHGADQLLSACTKSVCLKSKIKLATLSAVQRKFVTHYKCNQCGLLPLYYLDLTHIKRVRCTKCHQLVAFRKKGKYGRLRKEIAIHLMRMGEEKVD